MPLTTEFALLSTKAGANVADASSAESKALRGAFDVVISQPGAQHLFWAQEIEDPTNVRLFVDWDDEESHIAFTKSEVYEPMLDTLRPFVDFSAGFIKHVVVEPAAAGPLRAPVTEVFSAYFPADYSAADKEHVQKQFMQFVTAVAAAAAPADVFGTSVGWSLENDMPVPPKKKDDGSSAEEEEEEEKKTGCLFIAYIGWSTLEAHFAVRDTDAFRDNAHLIRTLPNVLGTGVFHGRYTEMVPA